MTINKQKKFTLIEILAAVAILAILAGITTGIIGYVRAKTSEARTLGTIEIIKVALEQYKVISVPLETILTLEYYSSSTHTIFALKTKTFVE